MNTGRTIAASGNPNIDGLLTGSAWQDTALTYSFPANAGVYGPNAETYGDAAPFNGFMPLTPGAQAATRTIMAEFAEVIPFTITEVADGDIRNGFSTEPGVGEGSPNGAYAFGPGTENGGDVFYDNRAGFYTNPVVGDEAYLTIIHEIGHAFGLAHGHTPDNGFPTLPAGVDGNEFSVMTYRTFIGSDPGAPAAETFGWSQTLMSLDIAALQYMYGANYATRAGDTVYSFNETTGAFLIDGVVDHTPGANRVFLTTWDGNGNDTYDFSNYAGGVTVDLTPGGVSTLAADQIAQLSMDGSQLARGNVFNALLFNDDARSLIENATTGAGNDAVTGNQADNRLIGNAGADTLAGGAGNDQIFGGADDDRVLGGDGNDVLFGAGGNDVAAGGTGNDQIFGGDGNDGIAAGAGDDTAGGGMGNDSLFASSGADRVFGGAGDDVGYGGSENDKVFGGLGADTLAGGAGDDEIGAGAGDDNVAAGSGADTIFGADGNDTIFAVAGADSVFGGAGDDVIFLGNADGARDVYSSSATNGADVVNGFEDGTDLLNVRASGFDSFAAVAGRISEVGGNAVIDVGTGTITLNGVTAAQIDGADFEFAGT